MFAKFDEYPELAHKAKLHPKERALHYCIQVQWNPSKHAGSDPEVFWLWPVMAIMASMQPESDRIIYARSDFLHLFQFRFSKEGMDHTVQN